MKRTGLIPVCLAVIILIATSSYGNTFVVSSGDGVRGTTGHTISIVLNNDVAISGLQFDFVYNPTTFIIEDVTPTYRTEFFDVFIWNQNLPDTVSVVIFDLDFDLLPPDSGSIADVHLSVADDAFPGRYLLEMADAQASDSSVTPVDPDLVHGIFEVRVVLDSLRINPRLGEVACAETLLFHAIGYDTVGPPILLDAEWSVSPQHIGFIDTTGLFTGNIQTMGWIKSTYETWSDSVRIAVIPGDVVNMNVDPDSTILVSGTQQQFSVLGFDVCNNNFVPEVTWSITPEKMGTINSTGLFVAQAEGEGWVFATGSVKDSAYVLVQHGVATVLIVTPTMESAVLGDTIPYVANASDGLNMWDVTDATAFSTTDPAGYFTDNLYVPRSEGEWDIIGTYTFDTTTLSDTAHITVTPELLCERGDVNCDDAVTPGDALCTFWRSISGQFQPECECECSEEAAEINCDGALTPGDALCIFWRAIQGEWPEECECSPLAKDSHKEQIVTEIQVGSVRGKPQDIIRVPILVDTPKGFDAFALQMVYPADLLKFKNVSATAATENWIALEGILIAPGKLNIGGFNTKDVTVSGTMVIAEVAFLVKEGCTSGGEMALVHLADDLAGADVKNGNFVASNGPTTHALYQNYPNPFNATTDISFEITALDGDYSPFVSLNVYSILGQQIRSLVSRSMEPGYHTVTWDGKDETGQEVSSGIYFYRLTAGSPSRDERGQFTATRRLVFMK